MNLAPRKALGQHFLISRGVLLAVVAAAEISASDFVVEIGPGLGVLTRELARLAGKVVAVELDEELAGALAKELGPAVQVVAADARQIAIGELVGGRSGYKLLGNLPYYAAVPILRRFLEAEVKPSLAVVMLQREVAQEITATPGSMGMLSVAVQLYGRPRIVRLVPPGAFYPPPKVTSAVVRIDVYARPIIPVQDVGPFFRVVRAGFSGPRKQLRNSLGHGLGIASAEAAKLLEQAAIDPQRRAETISLEEWRRLYRAVESDRGP